MKVRAMFFLLVAVFIPVQSYAGWTGGASVNNIVSHGGLIVINTDIDVNPCGEAGRFWWRITDEDSDEMLAVAMLAYSTNSTVAVVHNPSNPDCKVAGQKMTHIRVARD